MEAKIFQVVIVGGSIAGLTLAHCLERLGVSYVVLEKRNEIAPLEGASIGIFPNGGRILDQLGLFEEVEKFAQPLHTSHYCFPDGYQYSNHAPDVVFERYATNALLLSVFADENLLSTGVASPQVPPSSDLSGTTKATTDSTRLFITAGPSASK